MASSLIPLPEPGEQTPRELLELSRSAIQLSFQRLTAGDYRQAADMVEKAIDLSTEAIAEQRGWQHGSKPMRSSVISQICVEIGSDTELVKVLHVGRAAAYTIPEESTNIAMYGDIISHSLRAAEDFTQVIEQLMGEPPKPYTVSRSLDAHRIAQLTGHEPDLGATDALGFTNFTGAVREG